jgi:hypothetical protein
VCRSGGDELPDTEDPETDIKLGGRLVTCVPYDPSVEMPDEGRANARLKGIQSNGQLPITNARTPDKPKGCWFDSNGKL